MINVDTPITDDTPTSCHIKYVAIIITNGPVHRNGKYKSVRSNRLTSFDIKFTICPVKVWSRESVLSRRA